MTTTHWQVQEAKARFSEVISAALGGEPQHITRHGKAAVVLISEQEFQAMRRMMHAAAPGFVNHLLAIPKNGEEESRLTLNPREVDLA